MRRWQIRALLAMCVVLVIAWERQQVGIGQNRSDASASSNQPSDAKTVGRKFPFDFYVLSLSWSPSYCLVEGKQADRQQCRTGSRYGFIVHGLWPQYEKGYPEFCRSEGRGFVPQGIEQSMFDIMPSRGLIRHQWKKHGTCSGLTQRSYFDITRKALNLITVPRQYRSVSSDLRVDPAAMENAFVRANPGLPADGIAVTCDGRNLREVRICLTSDLQFRACDEVDRNFCRAKSVLLPQQK